MNRNTNFRLTEHGLIHNDGASRPHLHAGVDLEDGRLVVDGGDADADDGRRARLGRRPRHQREGVREGVVPIVDVLKSKGNINGNGNPEDISCR